MIRMLLCTVCIGFCSLRLQTNPDITLLKIPRIHILQRHVLVQHILLTTHKWYALGANCEVRVELNEFMHFLWP